MARPAKDAYTPLPATSYPVLGLLSSGHALSGYDLKKWADSSLNFFYWSPALSHIYTELRRLEARGLVAHNIDRIDDLRNRRLYRITDAGVDELRAWLDAEPVEPPMLKHSIVLRVWLGHLAGADRVRDIVEDHLATTRSLLAQIRQAAANTPDDPSFHYAAAVVAWADDHYEAEIASFESLLQRVELGPAPAPEVTTGARSTARPSSPRPSAARPSAARPNATRTRKAG